MPPLSHGVMVILMLCVIIIITSCLLLWHQYPFGVKQYQTISLGMEAAERAGTPTIWAPPDDKVPGAAFYVYVLGDERMCVGPDCGMGGYFIECLGGWISGYKAITEEFDYGLRDAGVNMEKQTLITVADKNGSIVGIYPGTRIKNLPSIMRNHRDLVSIDTFKNCSNTLPQWWK